MKIAVIVTNAGQAANCDGGKCETKVLLFDLTPECAAFIATAQKNCYNVIQFALAEEPSPEVKRG